MRDWMNLYGFLKIFILKYNLEAQGILSSEE
jgi:hypothetical protein